MKYDNLPKNSFVFIPIIEESNKTTPKNINIPASAFRRAGEKEIYLQKLLERNLQEMKELLTAFHKEFRPIKKYGGFMLSGVKCGKSDCILCPHALVWREYIYNALMHTKYFYPDGKEKMDYKYLWANNIRHDSLPLSYKRRKRSAKSLARILQYEAKATKLNTQRKQISEVMTSFRNKFYGLLRSKAFKMD